MGDHKLAWILGIVTVVYLIAMILLFWRYRRAMDQLSDKMRECHEKEAAEKLAEAQNQQTEGITAIYRKPDAPEPEEVPETETGGNRDEKISNRTCECSSHYDDVNNRICSRKSGGGI